MPPTVRITVDGQPALTIHQAAARYGITSSSMRSALTRAKGAIVAAAELDGRTPIYLEDELDAFWKSRPGRGPRVR